MEKTDILVIGPEISGTSATYFSLTKEVTGAILIDKSWIGREATGATAGRMAFQNKEPP